MSKSCSHLDGIKTVTPSALGCEECLKSGSIWVHLRLCRTCGHVGCCDDSPNRHAHKHFHATRHPIIEGYDRPKGGDGVTSMRLALICRTALHPRGGRSRGTIESHDTR